MRRDEAILKEVELQETREAETGCCIRNDQSGCMQVRQVECSTLLSTFHKWSPSSPGPDRRTSGPVCGQDPQYCLAPKSSYADTWPDSITQWPVCQVSSAPPPINYFGLVSSEILPAPYSFLTKQNLGQQAPNLDSWQLL